MACFQARIVAAFSVLALFVDDMNGDGDLDLLHFPCAERQPSVTSPSITSLTTLEIPVVPGNTVAP